jgi:predicted  nucleic acid-binding Zn-ribbon protein
MRTRHRTPAIFNLYMIDVLCCALGCVILLLLLHVYRARAYEKEAQSKADEQKAMIAKLDAERSRWAEKSDAQSAELTELKGQLKNQQQQIAKLEEERDARRADYLREKGRVADLAKKVADTEARLASARDTADKVPGLEKELKKVRDDRAAGQERLTEMEKKLVLRLREIDEAGKALEGLRKAKAALEKELEKSNKNVADLLAAKAALEKQRAAGEKKLEGLEAARALLAKTVSQRDKELTAARAFKDKHARAEERILALLKQLGERDKELKLARADLAALGGDKKDLEKSLSERARDLEAARRSIATLESDKKALQGEARRIRAEVENRFAGIELTGRRVIFLIDTSGSMNMLDLETNAPGKWKEVEKTVARLMRSLPDLEKFQVLVFAPETRYLLGRPGKWLDYDPKTSVDAVARALASQRPTGGTNLYLPLEEAFKFREQGLDTIYLLSDGLPDRGPGLTETPPARTSAQVEALTRTIRDKLKGEWNLPRIAPLPGKPRRVRINTIGFFYESPDVGSFLWALARENAGSFVGMSRP